MDEISEVPVSSPAFYTIEDDDEPEVIFVSENNVVSDEDSRDGEPTSTTSDINGNDGTQAQAIDMVDDCEEYVNEGTQQETSESSDSSSEEQGGSGYVLNDLIKLIDLINSYQEHDFTVKTKFKDGFLFLEDLQTQFEETERNISEKDEIIAELIAENNKLTGENKQLRGEMSTQSLQFAMMRNKYVKMKKELEELNSLKKREEKVLEREPSVENLSLETMKSKADTLQSLFRQLSSKMSEEIVSSNDPKSVKSSKELKSFQNEVGVLFIKVQHKLSKWAKNQITMEEELERARMSLERLHDMVAATENREPAEEDTSGSRMETVSSPPSVTVVESCTNQPSSKKRKLPPPPLVPLNIASVSKCTSDTISIPEQKHTNSVSSVYVLDELPNTLFHSPGSELGTPSDKSSAMDIQLTDNEAGSFCVKSLQISCPSPPSVPTMHPSPPPAATTQPSTPPAETTQPSPPPAATTQPSPPHAATTQPSPPHAATTQPSPPTTATLQPSPPTTMNLLPMKSSHPLSPSLPDMKPNITFQTSTLESSHNLYELPPLPSLNFPLSPPKPITSTPPTSSSNQVNSLFVTDPSSMASQFQVPQPVKRKKRAKTLRKNPLHFQPVTSVESKYPLIPPQYSQAPAPYPVHPQHNPYSVSQDTPSQHTGPHQAALQAYRNRMMKLSTASQFSPHQHQQISSSVSPVATQNKNSPASVPETQNKQILTPNNKCLVCGMSFVTTVQLKLHHSVVHSNKKPSSALTGSPVIPTTTSTSSSSSSSHQQNLARSLLVPPPPLKERHQNATSLEKVSSTSTGSNQKRHCTGLSPLTSDISTSSTSKSKQIAPGPVNNTTNSVNSTQPYDTNNLFSFLDLL